MVFNCGHHFFRMENYYSHALPEDGFASINGTPSFTCLIVDPRESQRLPEEKQIDCSCFGMRFL